ncbi:hypothetical protein VPH35_088356 [Triticum aestivum]
MSSSSSAGLEEGGSTETIQCKACPEDVGGDAEDGVAAEYAELYDLTEGWGENDPAECAELVEKIEVEHAGKRLFEAVVYRCPWASWDDDDEVDSVACKRPKLY